MCVGRSHTTPNQLSRCLDIKIFIRVCVDLQCQQWSQDVLKYLAALPLEDLSSPSSASSIIAELERFLDFCWYLLYSTIEAHNTCEEVFHKKRTAVHTQLTSGFVDRCLYCRRATYQASVLLRFTHRQCCTDRGGTLPGAMSDPSLSIWQVLTIYIYFVQHACCICVRVCMCMYITCVFLFMYMLYKRINLLSLPDIFFLVFISDRDVSTIRLQIDLRYSPKSIMFNAESCVNDLTDVVLPIEALDGHIR